MTSFFSTGLFHLFSTQNCWVWLRSYFGLALYFLHEAQLNPCSRERISCFLQCFSRLSSYQISKHVRSIQMSNGEKYVQTLAEFRHAADCCHSEEKHNWEPNLVCFFYHLQHQGRWDILAKAYASWQQSRSQRGKPRVVITEVKAALVDSGLGPLLLTQNLTSFAFQS